jgi:hypothetical protein
MESAKVEETQRTSKESSTVIEMGRVSEETKGSSSPGFENIMDPNTSLP